ncbi:hypothetical protein KAX03_00500 [Candidatus Bathyarchaeota archaeon]|nr:hypothetical protein [Candidatus Bathyarchaeota archaeon]
MQEATISFALQPEYAQAFYSALHPETHFSPTQKTRVQIKLDDNILTLNFESQETSSLRGAVNSYLRWCILLQNVFKNLANKIET